MPMHPVAGYSRPRLVLSRCLELDACRYNGALVRAPLVGRLQLHVDMVPVCPEVEIGLGVPRAPIRLVRAGGATALVQPTTGRDLTRTMQEFAAGFLAALSDVDGFLLKARSPSCGVHGVKVFGDAASADAETRASGMFAAAVIAAFPEHPVEHEARLGNARLLDEFLSRLFARADLRAARGRGEDALALHRRHRGTLEAHAGKAEAARLHLLAGAGWRAYAEAFGSALARAAGPAAHERVLRRLARELAGGARGGERHALEALLEEYRAGRAARAAPLALLRRWAARAGHAEPGSYLDPYPAELRKGDEAPPGEPPDARS